jgi:hypothetical protein
MIMDTAIVRQHRLIILLSLCLLFSCGPRVFFFQARPCTTITEEDSVKFTWKVRGTPTLLHYQEDADEPDNPGKRYQYYKLVAKKGKKEAAFPTLGLTVLPESSIDYIQINTSRRGDSVVAFAVRDTLEWGFHFILDQVSSGSGRPMTVTHLGRTGMLDGEGNPSNVLKGLRNSGPWEFSSPLSEEEKKDSTRIPGKLRIKTVIIHH